VTRDAGTVSLSRPMFLADTQFHRLSVDDVYRMVEAGVLREEDRVELIDGVLVDMTRPSPEHSAAVAWLTRHLVGAAGEREVRVQDVLLVEGGFLVPDVMVIDPLPRDRHPSTAALVIEVAVTTHRHDAWKAGRYTRAGIAEYWIVDLPARTVTVHRRPANDGYLQTTRHGDGERIETPVGAPAVEVSALVGPAGT
jgi:Uma2 family endonuclease